MREKLSSAYEDKWIYYTLIVAKLLRVSVVSVIHVYRP